jgi:Divergent InlB B-repeat domain
VAVVSSPLGIRRRSLVCLAAVLGATLLAGAVRPAGAAPTGSDRALHCLTAFSFLQTFVAAGSGTVFPPSGLRPCGSVVQVTATPAENFRFIGWVGFCGGTVNPCNVFMADSTDHGGTYPVGARFERILQTVTIQRTGNGTVTSEPAGINCGTSCSAQFAQGGQIALDATPDPGIEFQGWGGGCSNAVRNKRCVLTVPNSAATVTATFGPPPVQLTVTRSGNGTITSSPAGINCGGTCSASFPSGSQVTLTATPAPEYPFQGWGGACSGTATTCRLTLTAATSVSARFSSGKVDNLAAGFRGVWRRSLYNGSLVLRGAATAEAQLTARISSESPAFRSLQARAIDQTFQFSVPAGPFERLFRLPATGFFPGRYTVTLTGTSGGAPILGRATTARMEPPAEGIVSRAWVTAGSARPVTRARRGTKRLVAHFVYLTKPFRGSKVTVSWFLGSRPLGTVRKIRWKPIVTTDVQSTAGLPSGRYRCVLRARGLIVSEVSVRVG